MLPNGMIFVKKIALFVTNDYFCNMIAQYKFYRHKYGNELLVDVIPVDRMKPSIRKTPSLSLTFYAIILFTKGGEELAVNGSSRLIKAGDVACARPGEIWEWKADTALEGEQFIFEEEFFLSFFNDRHFLERFPYLSADRPSPFLLPDEDLAGRLTHLYAEMKKEISRPEKDEHILRAMMYETLMLLSRAPFAQDSDTQAPGKGFNRHMEAFCKLADENYILQHDIDFYSDKLCITPNYLNKIVHIAYGVSTKQYLQKKLMDEAKRLLRYTDLSINEISDRLEYDNPSYFIRQFSKLTGTTPLAFRKAQR